MWYPGWEWERSICSWGLQHWTLDAEVFYSTPMTRRVDQEVTEHTPIDITFPRVYKDIEVAGLHIAIYTDTETQRHRDTETQRHRDTETQRHRDTETQRHRDTETQRHRDTETQRHRDTETQRHRDTETQRHRDTETAQYAESESHRFSKLSHSKRFPSLGEFFLLVYPKP